MEIHIHHFGVITTIDAGVRINMAAQGFKVEVTMEHSVFAGEFCFGSGFKYVHYSANSSVILSIITDYKVMDPYSYGSYGTSSSFAMHCLSMHASFLLSPNHLSFTISVRVSSLR